MSTLPIPAAFLLIAFDFWASAGPQGAWLQKCANGVQKTETIQGLYATLDESYFFDAGCEQPRITLQSSGPITLGGPSPEVETASLIDFVFAQVRLTLHSEALAQSANSTLLCGLQGWEAGSNREITGLACDLFGLGMPMKVPHAGQEIFGIYLIDGERLHFGKLTRERNGKSRDRRPNTLDSRYYLRIQ